MKTITLQGTEKKINNFILDNDLFQQFEDKFELVETRVYVIEESMSDFDTKQFDDESFMDLAEEQGRVYTLQNFQEAFNLEEINSSIDVIRFINVPLNN